MLEGLKGFPYGANYMWSKIEKEEWSKDVRTMKDIGFNIFRVWLPWQKIEREENKFNFSEMDQIVDAAEKNGISIQLTLALSPPIWFTKKYPDCLCRRHDETKVYRVCLDHPLFREEAEKYVRRTVEHYKEKNAVVMWNVWNEPTPSYCYCQFTVKSFQEWLKKKYRTIENLNESWDVFYRDWEEIDPPKPIYWFQGPAWVDWCTFNESNLATHIKWISDIVHSIDPEKPTHTNLLFESTLYSPVFLGVNHEFMIKSVDIFGSSMYIPSRNISPDLYSYVLDRLKSSSLTYRKEFWMTELQGGPTLWAHTTTSTPSPKDIKIWTWQAISHGAKGVLYFAWRPRLKPSYEGGEFGLTGKDGSLLERTKAASSISKILRKKIEIFVSSTPQKAKTAILYSYPAFYIAYGDRIEEPYTWSPDIADKKMYLSSSLWGAYKILWEENIPIEFISPQQILDGALSKYICLVLPFQYVINEDVGDKISEFVSSGGNVIADFACGMKDETAACYKTVPGAGLHEVFGCNEIDVEPAFNRTIHFSLAQDFLGNKTGFSKISANQFKEILKPAKESRIVGYFDTGEPAIIFNNYGKGHSLFIGTLLFRGYYMNHDPAIKLLIKSFLNYVGINPSVIVNGVPPEISNNVEGQILKSEKESVVVLINHNDVPIVAKFQLSECKDPIVDLETGKEVPSATKENAVELLLKMDAKEVKILTSSNA